MKRIIKSYLQGLTKTVIFPTHIKHEIRNGKPVDLAYNHATHQWQPVVFKGEKS